MTEQTNTDKVVADKLDEMGQRIDELFTLIKELIKQVPATTGHITKHKVVKISPNLLFLKKIYAGSGIIAQDDLTKLSKETGIKKVGPFFRGANASLTYVRQPEGRAIALTQSGYQRLVQAHLVNETKQ